MLNDLFLKDVYLDYCQNSLNKKVLHIYKNEFERLFTSVALKNKTFLDIGAGMGLSSLLATQAGAVCCAVDIDIYVFNLIKKNKKRFFQKYQSPKILVGSILDKQFLQMAIQVNTKRYDIVHAWGVFHHTGKMWQAIKNAQLLVADQGFFVFSLYNAHWTSPLWKIIKLLYIRSPLIIKKCIYALVYSLIAATIFLYNRKKPSDVYVHGIDFTHLVLDLLNGYPYEYAKPTAVISFMEHAGFKLQQFFPTEYPTGCNEYVFKKVR